MTNEFDNKFGRSVPGEARGAGPSLHELLLRDQIRPPDVLLEESPVFLGDEDISFERYTSKSFVELEMDRMWSRVWQWACREEQVPEVGDYLVYDLADMSALIVRTPERGIKAFVNSCMHRGTQLKPPGSCGMSTQLTCPFHGWTWSLEGKLIDLPQSWDFPHVGEESHHLVELPSGTWGGFVFVNFNLDAGPLEDYLGVLTEHFAGWDLGERYTETHVCKRLPANWKAAAEAFIEAYHVRETHAGGAEGMDCLAQYDVFDTHVNRFIHTVASPNPNVDPPLSEQEHLEKIMKRVLDGAEAPPLPEGSLARDHYAEWHRKNMSEKYQRDCTGFSTSETLDSIEYYLFPNAFFFPGLTLPMIYRFRPDGMDPDRCIFDLLMLKPCPENGKPPPPSEPVYTTGEESYTLVPCLGPLGVGYDEDTVNMAAQTRGMKASRKGSQTLGNYQESRIRHLHKTLDNYLK